MKPLRIVAMSTLGLGKSPLVNWLLTPAGWAMESRLRRLLHDPGKILRGAGVATGQSVLEVGSGTGFFTLPAARRIGAEGRLIAIEPLATYTTRLRARIDAAGLGNVEILRRDALDTGLPAASFDRALLFGVLPFPTLPLPRLLPEMHRVLKPDGRLAVWMFPAAGRVPGAIGRTRWFTLCETRDGVYSYRPRTAGS